MGGGKVHRGLMGNPVVRNLFVDLGVDGRIILKWIFKMWYGG